MMVWLAVLATAAGMVRAAAGAAGRAAACFKAAMALVAGTCGLAGWDPWPGCGAAGRLTRADFAAGAACLGGLAGAGFGAGLAWAFGGTTFRLGLATLAAAAGCLRLAGFFLAFFAPLRLEAIFCAMSFSLYIRVKIGNPFALRRQGGIDRQGIADIGRPPDFGQTAHPLAAGRLPGLALSFG